jgi:hypothetical protein
MTSGVRAAEGAAIGRVGRDTQTVIVSRVDHHERRDGASGDRHPAG